MSILVDTNLLVYGAVPSSPHHAATRAWLEERFAETDATVALTWSVLYAFMRLLTNRRVVGTAPIGTHAAWEASERYRLQPNVSIVEPGGAHADIAAALMATPGLATNDIPDVYLAATAIESGLILCSHDHGFARFTGLRWQNPLLADGAPG